MSVRVNLSDSEYTEALNAARVTDYKTESGELVNCINTQEFIRFVCPGITYTSKGRSKKGLPKYFELEHNFRHVYDNILLPIIQAELSGLGDTPVVSVSSIQHLAEREGLADSTNRMAGNRDSAKGAAGKGGPAGPAAKETAPAVAKGGVAKGAAKGVAKETAPTIAKGGVAKESAPQTPGGPGGLPLTPGGPEGLPLTPGGGLPKAFQDVYTIRKGPKVRLNEEVSTVKKKQKLANEDAIEGGDEADEGEPSNVEGQDQEGMEMNNALDVVWGIYNKDKALVAKKHEDSETKIRAELAAKDAAIGQLQKKIEAKDGEIAKHVATIATLRTANDAERADLKSKIDNLFMKK
jgi:hypothetical protein